MRDFENTNWGGYLDQKMRELVTQSFALLEMEEGRGEEKKFHDYSFVVFPAAKAYEGFLKKVFLDMRLITPQQYYSDHFRIGRALSPTLPVRYRSGWVFGRLIENCRGDSLPLQMWEVWKKCRNRTFHYFPQHEGLISLPEARELLSEITVMMDRTLSGCRVNDTV